MTHREQWLKWTVTVVSLTATIALPTEADVAGTLEDYLICANEYQQTKDRDCKKCIKPKASSEVSWEVCAAPLSYESDGYEKVCESVEYGGSKAEVWCKTIPDAGAKGDDADSDTTTNEKENDEKEENDSSDDDDGCSTARVGLSSDRVVFQLLRHFVFQ